MGRTTAGVEVREASIRLSFTAAGVRYRHTLMVEGEAMLPTPANVKYANRLIAEIRARVKTGVFRMADYFPDADTSVPAQEHRRSRRRKRRGPSSQRSRRNPRRRITTFRPRLRLRNGEQQARAPNSPSKRGSRSGSA
jgi:hypothetical protein